MFYLVGIGLKPGHLTPEAKEAIEKCGRVFLDTYTSAYSEGSVKGLEAAIGKTIVPLGRNGIEEGFAKILKDAKESGEGIALLVFGNALSATTHVQLLIDAKRIGIPFRAIAGISIFDFLGATGLDQYRFGRTCTIVAPCENYAPESFYNTIEANFRGNLHTLCLLDIDAERDYKMPVSEALGILSRIEKRLGKSVLKEATLVGLYALGSAGQVVKAGSLEKLSKSGFASFPQSLVVAARLTEKEKEALEALNG
jgi:diphthine synthase